MPPSPRRFSRLQLEPASLEIPTGSRANPPVNLPPWLPLTGTESFELSPASNHVRWTPWVPLKHQKPPTDVDWLYWFLLAGRGAGKTLAGARYVDWIARNNPGFRFAVIAPTLGDARAVCVEGESGILSVNRSVAFHRSWGELRWPNGSVGQLFGAFTPEDVERLRGPQHHLAWLDEFAAWRQLKDCWDMMRLGLRLGDKPRAIITTTPKPRARLLELMQDDRAVVTRAHTDDNPHLHPTVRAELYSQYGGTRLGQQELAAEILTDVVGALWTRENIEANRVREAPALLRVVIAIDPSGGSSEGHAEVGIVAAGRGGDAHAYVLRDVSERLAPERWARRAVQLYYELKADRIIAEANYGGAMVEATIRAVDPSVPVRLVSASRGKRLRAEPVSALDEQGKIHHVGLLAELEEQLCSWVPDSGDASPDRLDARVWAITELMLGAEQGLWFA